ncbi:MAG: GNAT family N-acetyltransferase [Defluviitaleaceae bacterium]|nr:GNAT family N-acetyltransferase [Defluviitaleaceae bacterium]
MEYAFETLNLQTIKADTVLRNTRSQHVLEKIGFVYTHEDVLFKYYELHAQPPSFRA